MVDFSSQRYVGDSMTAWDERHAARSRQDHERWQQRELRRRYDEEARLTRAESDRQQQFYQQNAGLFTNDMFNNMDQRVPTQPTPAAAAPAATPAAGTPAGTGTPAAPAPRQPNVREIGELNDATLGFMEPPTAREENSFNVRNATQRAAVSRYISRFNDTINSQTRSLQPLARALDDMVNTGLMTQQEANRELTRVAQYSGLTDRQRNITRNVTPEYAESINAGIRAANPGVDFTGTEFAAPGTQQRQTGVTGPGLTGAATRVNTTTPAPTTGAGLETPTANAGADAMTEYFRGINDTSRPLQPTREMRIAQAMAENDFQRAQLYAAHGRPDLANESFARGLQGQAQLITMGRTVLYRAAANGSLRAGERLMEEFNGYPQGSVRINRAGNNVRIEVATGEEQDEAGNWMLGGWTTIGEVSRNEYLGGLQSLVDAEGAAARSEANQEYRIALMENQRHLTVAGIEAQVALERMATDVQIAQISAEARAMIAAGQAEVVQNDETGEIMIFYPRYHNGQVYQEMERISMETQRSPDTRGRREVQVPVRQRITGNVGAN